MNGACLDKMQNDAIVTVRNDFFYFKVNGVWRAHQSRTKLENRHLVFFGASGQQTVVQEVEKSVSNQKVASSIPCRSVLEQDTQPLIAPDVQCAISVNVKCVYIVSRTYVSRFG